MARPNSTHSILSHMTERTEKSSFTPVAARAMLTPVIPAYKSWIPYAGPVLFTGPSGLRDQRVKTDAEFQMGYFNRAAPGAAFLKTKNEQVGEIGWVYDKLAVVKGI